MSDNVTNHTAQGACAASFFMAKVPKSPQYSIVHSDVVSIPVASPGVVALAVGVDPVIKQHQDTAYVCKPPIASLIKAVPSETCDEFHFFFSAPQAQPHNAVINTQAALPPSVR